MKTRFLIIKMVAVAILSSCSSARYNRVFTYDDEFRGSSRKYVRLQLGIEEVRSEVDDARIVFESSSTGKGRQSLLYVVIPRASYSFRADGTGFLGAGGSKYELTLEDPVSELKMRTEETFSSVTSIDSTGTETRVTSDSDTRQWIDEKFMLRLTEEQRASILGSPEAVFRFYFGPVPATYFLRGRKLEMVKEVLR